MNLFYKSAYKVILIFLITVQQLNAQYKYNLSNYEIGAQIGGLVSRTSLTYDNLGAYKQMHPSIGFFIQGPLLKPFSFRSSFMLGQVGADDSKMDDPKYSFIKLRKFKYKTTMAEISTVVVWNLVKENYNLFTQEHKHKFTPYLFAGIGFSYVNVKRDWSGIDTAFFRNTYYLINLAIDTLPSNLPKVITVFPMGGGFRYAATPKIALFVEINFRYNFEKYLDGFNFTTYRANSKDFFYGISLGVSYRPYSNDYRNDCPKSVL